MSERDEYIPTMDVSNAAPARWCDQCGQRLYTLFFVNTTPYGTITVCAKCRP